MHLSEVLVVKALPELLLEVACVCPVSLIFLAPDAFGAFTTGDLAPGLGGL